MVILICFIILSSFILPAIAQDNNQSGQGSGNHGNDNNSPYIEPNESPNDSSGFDNQQGGKNQGDGQQKKQMQDNQEKGGYRYQQRRHQHRKMNCTGDHNQSRIRSQWRLNNSIDAFEIDFKTDPEPSIILYYMPTGDEANIQLTFKIVLKKLVEFSDLNSNGRFDYSDMEISTYSFELMNFTNITYSNETISTGVKILQMSTQTVDEVFAIDLCISDNFTTYKNQLLSPSEMKIDFIIYHYPYLENNSLLALLIDITTDHNLSVESESFDERRGYAFNESAINISSMDYSGFLSWLNTVTVDGINKSVQTSILGGVHPISKDIKTVQHVSFSYPHGTEIIHDPKIGVISQSFTLTALNNILFSDLNVYFTYFISCILAVIIFIGIITIRKRL